MGAHLDPTTVPILGNDYDSNGNTIVETASQYSDSKDGGVGPDKDSLRTHDNDVNGSDSKDKSHNDNGIDNGPGNDSNDSGLGSGAAVLRGQPCQRGVQ